MTDHWIFPFLRSIGALATLFDASCIVDLIEYCTSGTNTPVETTINVLQAALGKSPLILGHHYFINNPTGAAGVSPTFDFRADSEKGNPEAFVVTSKTEDVKSPVDPTQNVDWLQLTAIPGNGELASTVYRIFTLGGQPAASACLYFFFFVSLKTNISPSAHQAPLQLRFHTRRPIVCSIASYFCLSFWLLS